jgi:hypothetical protein
VAQAHDLAVFGLGANLEAGGQRLALDYQRVITGCDEIIRHVRKNSPLVMPDARDLAVHDLLRPHHLAAERLPDGLMSKTHAEDRDAPGEALDG